jgi:hypothetical protein
MEPQEIVEVADLFSRSGLDNWDWADITQAEEMKTLKQEHSDAIQEKDSKIETLKAHHESELDDLRVQIEALEAAQANTKSKVRRIK